jgi:hypothetical protein
MKVDFDPIKGLTIDIRHYEIIEFLGLGAFSIVFKVKKVETGKFYAAKISRTGGFGGEAA